MMAQSAVRDDPAYFDALLEFWKGQMRREFVLKNDEYPAGAGEPKQSLAALKIASAKPRHQGAM
jgi:hypothetical protein